MSNTQHNDINNVLDNIKKILTYEYNEQKYTYSINNLTISKEIEKFKQDIRNNKTALQQQNIQNETLKAYISTLCDECLRIINNPQSEQSDMDNITNYCKQIVQNSISETNKENIQLYAKNIQNYVQEIFDTRKITLNIRKDNSDKIRNTLKEEINKYLKQTNYWTTPSSKINAMKAMLSYLNNEITFDKMNEIIENNTGCFSKLKKYYFSKYSRVAVMSRCIDLFNSTGNLGQGKIEMSSVKDELNQSIENLNVQTPGINGYNGLPNR